MLKQLLKPALAPLVRKASAMVAPPEQEPPLSTWGLHRGPDGVLAQRGVRLDTVLAAHGSPIHVVDAHKLKQNAADFLAVPAGLSRGCEVAYSFKTNPVPGVLRRLSACGVGAEVISEYELWLALELGFEPSGIVYNGPAKSEASLRTAIERGIGLVSFNSRCEIAPFAKLAREMGRRPRVGVRVVVPGGWSGQLGERIDTGHAMRAFEEALQARELSVVALHSHLGGEIATKERLLWFVGEVLRFSDELHRRLGLEISVLDLGGSLACPTVRSIPFVEGRMNRTFGAPIPLRAPGSVLSIREAVQHIAEKVAQHYQKAGRNPPRIILEPGRAMTSNTQMLLTRVVHVQDEVDGITHVVLDAGFCIASPVPHEAHQLLLVGPHRPGPEVRYRLTGPICSPADVLYPSILLPRLMPGDALAIMDTGAYFIPFASSFSFPQPGVVMIEDGQCTALRRPETFEHMTALDVRSAEAERVITQGATLALSW